MGDFPAGWVASKTEHVPISKEPKMAILNECCDVAAALRNGTYAEELSEMRKAVDQHGGSLNEADRAIGLKFLLDCSLKVEKAAKKYVQRQKWRASFVPLGYVPDSEVSSFLAAETVALAGKARNGWPVVVVYAGKVQPKHDYEATKRFIVYMLEKASASGAEVGRLIAILDLNRVGLKHLDLNQFVVAFQLQQKYYPGLLGKLYMVNSPKFFITAWKLIAPLLPKATKEKIVFLESHDTADVLLSDMDADVIPATYGGRGEVVFLQNVRVPSCGLPAESF